MAKKDSKRIIEIREKANQRRREEQKAQKRRTILLQVGIIVGILVIAAAVVGGVLLAQNNKPPAEAPSASGTISLLGTSGVPLVIDGTAVRLGSADAPVTIDIYEDYSCPHCADYEAGVGHTLLSLVASGDAVVNFHPMGFVTPYGTAAGSAAACVAAQDPARWPAFHTALFANHNQQTDRWSAKDFADYARALGITDESTLKCITSQKYVGWIGTNTDAARDAGVSQTPTLIIDGHKQQSLLGPDDLVAAVQSAKG